MSGQCSGRAGPQSSVGFVAISSTLIQLMFYGIKIIINLLLAPLESAQSLNGGSHNIWEKGLAVL